MPPLLRTTAVCWLGLVWAVAGLNEDVSAKPDGGLRGAAAKPDDYIEAWPGQPADLPLESYGGYITVDAEVGRQLYYVLVAAERDEVGTKPLVLWLNGGPGCSSIAGGLMSELGPFYPTPSGDALVANPYRWNQYANMLFLESPAFVGFSYSLNPADRVVGDERTAQDSVEFLLGFLRKHPRLADRDIYLAGESYAGHYVPGLADAILDHNHENPDRKLNLKGFLVGNAWTNAAIDNLGAADFWFDHALISEPILKGIQGTCNISDVGPLTNAEDDACDFYVDRAMAEMDNINIYDIYVPTCYPYSRAAAANRLLEARFNGATSNRNARIRQQRQQQQDQEDGAEGAGGRSLRSGQLGARAPSYDPCIDDEVMAYMNNPAVQAAIHANTTGKAPGPWSTCSNVVEYSRGDLLASMLPTYKKLLAEGLHVLVYSGDVDAIVPVTGTRRWIRELGLTLRIPWHAWHTSRGQVGGYVEVFEGLTFATVRGAGHMVPYTQPKRALVLFRHFLDTARSDHDGSWLL